MINMQLRGCVTMADMEPIWQERDPIERIRKLLLSHEIASVAELKVKTLLSFSSINGRDLHPLQMEFFTELEVLCRLWRKRPRKK